MIAPTPRQMTSPNKCKTRDGCATCGRSRVRLADDRGRVTLRIIISIDPIARSIFGFYAHVVGRYDTLFTSQNSASSLVSLSKIMQREADSVRVRGWRGRAREETVSRRRVLWDVLSLRENASWYLYDGPRKICVASKRDADG